MAVWRLYLNHNQSSVEVESSFEEIRGIGRFSQPDAFQAFRLGVGPSVSINFAASEWSEALPPGGFESGLIPETERSRIVRPWKLAETNYDYVRAHQFEVAVLPLGATEPHNLHLPYGTDTFEGDAIGERICGDAHDRGAKVVLLPTIPYGTETNQRAFPLSLNVNPSTLGRVITDLVESLVTSGIRKIVLLNSHGGNDFKPLLRELYGQTEAHLFLIDWFRAVRDVEREIFADPGDHAGELETALGLAYFPQFVARRDDGSLMADDGATAATRFEAVNRGWVSITRPWHLLTTNSGAGNPHPATAEKGRQLMDVLAERFVPFLVELSQTKLDEKFPFA
ncbi:MAG: creatininase family protein [Pirellulales bacterium]|nr:creatininase family protein [Pirellulales bacterium]